MQNMLSIFKLLAQTAAQKGATLAGVGCVMMLFVVLLMDKSKYSGKLKTILLVFMFLFVGIFALLYFVVFK